MTWRPKPYTRPENLVAKASGRRHDRKGPVENNGWLARIRRLPCICCPHGRQTSPTRAHHPKGLFPRTMGLQISDLLCLQLCDQHHTIGAGALHRTLDELGWWRSMGVDPYGVILSNLAGCRDEARDEAVAFVKLHRERQAA